MKVNFNKLIKRALIFSFLLVAFSIFYHYVIFLPQEEEARLEQIQGAVSLEELDKEYERLTGEKPRIPSLEDLNKEYERLTGEKPRTLKPDADVLFEDLNKEYERLTGKKPGTFKPKPPPLWGRFIQEETRKMIEGEEPPSIPSRGSDEFTDEEIEEIIGRREIPSTIPFKGGDIFTDEEIEEIDEEINRKNN